MNDCAPFAVIVEYCRTSTVVVVDMRPVGVTEVGVRELGDQLGGHVAAMLDQVRRDWSLWLMRVMMCVYTFFYSAEDAMIGRKTLRLRLSDGTEVLT